MCLRSILFCLKKNANFLLKRNPNCSYSTFNHTKLRKNIFCLVEIFHKPYELALKIHRAFFALDKVENDFFSVCVPFSTFPFAPCPRGRIDHEREYFQSKEILEDLPSVPVIYVPLIT